MNLALLNSISIFILLCYMFRLFIKNFNIEKTFISSLLHKKSFSSKVLNK